MEEASGGRPLPQRILSSLSTQMMQLQAGVTSTAMSCRQARPLGCQMYLHMAPTPMDPRARPACFIVRTDRLSRPSNNGTMRPMTSQVVRHEYHQVYFSEKATHLGWRERPTRCSCPKCASQILPDFSCGHVPRVWQRRAHFGIARSRTAR